MPDPPLPYGQISEPPTVIQSYFVLDVGSPDLCYYLTSLIHLFIQSSSHSNACYFAKHFGYASDLKCSLLISCICISINHRNELESSNFNIHFYLWDLKATPIFYLIFQLENRVNVGEMKEKSTWVQVDLV